MSTQNAIFYSIYNFYNVLRNTSVHLEKPKWTELRSSILLVASAIFVVLDIKIWDMKSQITDKTEHVKQKEGLLYLGWYTHQF